MKITNLNPDTDIGASAWFVEFERHRLLLDAGMHPKREGRAGLPLFDVVRNSDLDAVVISHCHHDHVGALPVALRHFPRANVVMSELSYFLVDRVLHNSVNVMQRQRDELGIREYPLYRHEELEELFPRYEGVKYNHEFEWAALHRGRAYGPSPTLEFHDAGHTLGSAGVMVRGRKETLFYTGDVCFHDQTIMRGARFEDVQADVLILETTRGNRATPPGFSRETEIARLVKSIQRVLKRKGSVLIPSFGLGRTQEILALLALLIQQGQLRKQTIYISGLGRVFTEIYDLQAHRTHRSHSNLQLHEALDLAVLDANLVRHMRLGGGKLFVVTSGMMNENTSAHDLALRMMGDERQAIFFVGYADPETPAGRLRTAQPGKPFAFSPAAMEATVECEVDSFDLTAHAQREDLLEFVSAVNPRVVFLGHGSEDSRHWFATQIRQRHPRMKIVQPQPGKAIEA